MEHLLLKCYSDTESFGVTSLLEGVLYYLYAHSQKSHDTEKRFVLRNGPIAFRCQCNKIISSGVSLFGKAAPLPQNCCTLHSRCATYPSVNLIRQSSSLLLLFLYFHRILYTLNMIFNFQYYSIRWAKRRFIGSMICCAVFVQQMPSCQTLGSCLCPFADYPHWTASFGRKFAM